VGVEPLGAGQRRDVRTLAAQRGNISRTADVLGVSLKTVYNKLVGYGIATPAAIGR